MPPKGLFDPPVVGQNEDGRLEVFVKGKDDELWHIWQDGPGGWSLWDSLGMPPKGFFDPPVVVQNEDGRLEVFVKGKDGELWHIWQFAPNDGWSLWDSFGMPSW
jgi:hypothetical protein